MVSWNEERRITLVVHGDDSTASGWRSEMTWLEKKMGGWYEIKTRDRLDGVTHGMQEMTILNREITWNGHTLTYQADPNKHVQIVAKEFGSDEWSKGLEVPITRDLNEEDDADDELHGSEVTRYRALAARINYLSQDRVDVQFAAKERAQECRSQR